MSFDVYYGINDEMPFEEKMARFILGTSPKAFHASYMDFAYVDVQAKRGPSSSVGVAMCAAMAGATAIKLLLGWKGIRPVPCYAQFDLRRGIWHEGRLWGGNRHPWQRIKIAALIHKLQNKIMVPSSKSRSCEKFPIICFLNRDR